MASSTRWKGRAEEAVGDVTDDESPAREGAMDQAKEKADTLIDKIKSIFKRDR